MAEFHRGRLTVVGFGSIIDAKYKDASGRLRQLTPLIADGEGGASAPGMMFGVTEPPYGWTYAASALLSSATYDLAGTVIPVTATVHLSRAQGGAAYAQLVAGEFATVTPDAAGAWSYEGLAGFDDTLYAWILLDGAALDAYDCAVSCDMTVTARTPSGGGNVVYAAIPMDQQITAEAGSSNTTGQASYSLMEINNFQGYPTITAKGTCPAEATQVYVSKHPLEACPTCTCQTCAGIGIIRNGATCITCGGTGEHIVTTTRDCRKCSGTGTFEDDTCPNCNGVGSFTDTQTVCRTCGGVGTVNMGCTTCGATGVVGASPCGTCGGSRVVQSLITEAVLTEEVVAITAPSYTCADCGGTGSKSSTCTTCGGTGAVEDAECTACGGTGSVSTACETCGGDGTLDANTYGMTWDGEYHRIPDGDGLSYIGSWYGGTGSAINRYGPPWPEWNYIIWCVADSGEITMSLSAIHRMCLSGETPIRMADGTERRLDELSLGDLVLGGDGTPTLVVRVQRGRFNPYHTLYRFDNGNVIDATAPHRFYNVEQGFYQWLDRWKIGEHALTADGGVTALASVERVDEPAECFGLWTAARDYWAGGLLSGETAANQRLIAEATAEQAAAMAASLTEKDIAELSGWEAMTP